MAETHFLWRCYGRAAGRAMSSGTDIDRPAPHQVATQPLSFPSTFQRAKFHGVGGKLMEHERQSLSRIALQKGIRSMHFQGSLVGQIG